MFFVLKVVWLSFFDSAASQAIIGLQKRMTLKADSGLVKIEDSLKLKLIMIYRKKAICSLSK